ncbi:serine hydrolase domain-containing protein [Methylogaea oryzae]|uniref:Serine hydrolase n=1 Tax=Methylogaea oryzae TaxID=1295382 RepID=A0A8D4VP81_9GAMM|nr:serine hydrolase domain-containing protein [Methylogaea oryzae]BBL71525.1 serine hydrolase [Methylogaea oryzae]
MKYRALSLLLVGAMLLPPAMAGEVGPVVPETVGLSSVRLDRVSGFIRRHVEEKKMAGAVVLIARKGKIAYFEPFGQADEDKPMRKDTMFRIASMTKPLVSVALLQLYEEGRLLLSDPVAKYIPEFAHPKVLEMLPEGSNPPFRLVPAKRDITVKDLLRHTAGLPYGFAADWHPNDPLYRQIHALYEEAGISSGLYETGGSIGDMVKRLARLPLARQPGEAFEYGMAADVQGYLVEVVSGMRLDDYLREKVFKPLKMNDTYFFLPESERSRLSALWKSDWKGSLEKVTDGPHQEGAYRYSPSYQYAGPKTFLSGGVGVTSTAYDYYRFCQMLLNKGTLDGTRLLSRKTVELMTATNQIGELNATTLHDDGWKFGLGVAIQADRAHGVDAGSVGAFEWAGIFSTRFSVDPSEQKITIFLSQTHPFNHHFDLWDKLLVLSASAIDD